MSPGGRDVLDLEEKRLMAERARLLARPPTSRSQRELFARVSIVAVGVDRFGLPVASLVEIVPCPAITPLPGLPDWILGLANTRDGVVSVVDLGRWFGLPKTPPVPAYIAVVSGTPGRIALGVEHIDRFEDIYAEDVANALAREDASGLPILATTTELLTIIDPVRLFETPSIRAVRRTSAAPAGGRA